MRSAVSLDTAGLFNSNFNSVSNGSYSESGMLRELQLYICSIGKKLYRAEEAGGLEGFGGVDYLEVGPGETL